MGKRKKPEPRASPERKGKHFEPFEDRYIRKHFLTMDYRTIATNLGRSKFGIQSRCIKLGLTLPIEVRKARNNYFQKGHIPVNKGKKQKDYMSRAAIKRTMATRFKKGDINHNSLFDGAITVRYDHPNRKNSKPHKYIRISKGIWKELQIYNWEKKKGPVPKGFVLACKDGNPLNCKTSNWFLLSKGDNAIRNAGHKNLPDTYVAHLLAGRKNKDLKYEFLKYPELIELKRKTIVLSRNLKNKTDGKKCK